MQRYSTNLKVPLMRKDQTQHREISNFAYNFKQNTGLVLASRDAQLALFGRQIGDPDSVEIQFVMLVLLQRRFEESTQAASIIKSVKDNCLKQAKRIYAKVMSRHYSGKKHNILMQMRRTRIPLVLFFFLIGVGLIILFATQIRNRLESLCSTTDAPVPEIILITAIGLAMVLGVVLFGYEVIRAKDLGDYGKHESSTRQLLDKFSPNVMRNTGTLCAFCVLTTVVTGFLCFGKIEGEKLLDSKLELALTGTIGILAALSLIIMVASYCNLAIDLTRKPVHKTQPTTHLNNAVSLENAEEISFSV